MKRRKTLIPVSIALPGLLAVAANAYNTGYEFNNPNPPWDADATAQTSSGYTDAHYQSATAKDIHRLAEGVNVFTSQWETMYDTVAYNATYVAATYSWNPGCYSQGYSRVWGEGDGDSIYAIGIPNGKGAHAEVY